MVPSMLVISMISLSVLVLCASCADDGGSTAPANAHEHSLEAASLGSTPNVHKFGSMILAGQPSPDDFRIAHEQGVKVVINMRHEAEIAQLGEKKLVEDLGMTYIAIPWSAPDEMSDELFLAYRNALNANPDHCLLHCGSANRVGAIWIAWRALDGGIAPETATAEARIVGLRSQEYLLKALDYVGRNKQ